MKYAIVDPQSCGPTVYQYSSIEQLAQVLMLWLRAGVSSNGGSIWKKVRGKWVPLNEWAMRAN